MTKQHTLVSLLLLCDSLKITVKLDYCFQAVYGPQHCNDTGTDCTQQWWSNAALAAACCLQSVRQQSCCRHQHTVSMDCRRCCQSIPADQLFSWRICRAWGKVKQVKEHIASSKTGPRVGKAISIILDLDDDTIREWFLISWPVRSRLMYSFIMHLPGISQVLSIYVNSKCMLFQAPWVPACWCAGQVVTGHAQHSQHLSCASEQPFVSRSNARRDIHQAECKQRVLQQAWFCSCENKVQICMSWRLAE